MDTVKFAIEYYRVEEFEYDLPNIHIYINGHNLIDLITRVEKKEWTGEKESRSGYIGIEVSHFQRFQNEMLGKKIYPHSVLLTCTCTMAECNCIMADIRFEDHIVTWNNIRSPWLSNTTYSPFVEEIDAIKEGWVPIDYSNLGPFRFERKEYLAAIDQIVAECRSYKVVKPALPEDWRPFLDLFNEE